jgi:hypothetical protein
MLAVRLGGKIGHVGRQPGKFFPVTGPRESNR